MPYVFTYLLSLGIFFVILFSLLAVLIFAFWIWMIVDALTNPELDTVEKVIWAAIVFFLHLVGALIYFFVARSRTPYDRRPM